MIHRRCLIANIALIFVIGCMTGTTVHSDQLGYRKLANIVFKTDSGIIDHPEYWVDPRLHGIEKLNINKANEAIKNHRFLCGDANSSKSFSLRRIVTCGSQETGNLAAFLIRSGVAEPDCRVLFQDSAICTEKMEVNIDDN